MNKQLTTETLANWIEGRLDAAEAARVEAALAEALPDDRARADWLRQFAAWGAQIQLPAPPPEVRAALRARFAQRFAGRSNPQPSAWQRFVGLLQFDSWAQGAALAGARAADLDARHRQLLFNTPTVDVALHLERDSAALTVAGQLLPADGGELEPYAVQLLSADEQTEIALTRSDALGEFMLNAPAGGSYALVICGSTLEIILTLPDAQA